jgi:hypothetical protein
MDMYLDTMDCEAKTAILGLKGRQLVCDETSSKLTYGDDSLITGIPEL